MPRKPPPAMEAVSNEIVSTILTHSRGSGSRVDQQALQASLQPLLERLRAFTARQYSYAVDHTLTRLIGQSRHSDVFALLTALGAHGLPVSADACFKLECGLLKQNRHRQALRLVRDLPALGIAPEARNYSAAIFAMRDQPDGCKQAEALFQEALSVTKPDDAQRNILVHSVLAVFNKADRWDMAHAFLQEQLQLGMHATERSFAGVITNCGNNGQLRLVLELVQQAKQHGRADYITYCAALSACRHARKPKEALQLLQDAKATLGEVPLAVYEHAMAALAQVGASGSALHLLKEMESRGLKSPKCAKLAMHACAMSSNTHASSMLQHLLQRVGRHGASDPHTTQAVTLSALISSYKTDEALALLQDPERCMAIDEDGFALAVKACARVDHPRLALRIARTAQKFLQQPSPRLFAHVIDIFCLQRRLGPTLSLVNELRADGVCNSHVYKSALIAAAGAQDASAARELVRMWRQDSLPLEEMSNLMRISMHATSLDGHSATALQLLAEARQHGVATADLFNECIRVCGRAGDERGALALLRELDVSGLQRTAGVVTAVMDALTPASANLVHVLLQEAQAQLCLNSRVFGSAISCFLRANDVPAARTLVERMRTLGMAPCWRSLHAVLECLWRNGEVERMLPTYLQAESQVVLSRREVVVKTVSRTLPTLERVKMGAKRVLGYDLHEHSIFMAVPALRRMLRLLNEQWATRDAVEDVFVVTGWGRHSAQGVGVLQRFVPELFRLGFDPPIRMRRVAGNPGAFRVRGEDLWSVLKHLRQANTARHTHMLPLAHDLLLGPKLVRWDFERFADAIATATSRSMDPSSMGLHAGEDDDAEAGAAGAEDSGAEEEEEEGEEEVGGEGIRKGVVKELADVGEAAGAEEDGMDEEQGLSFDPRPRRMRVSARVVPQRPVRHSVRRTLGGQHDDAADASNDASGDSDDDDAGSAGSEMRVAVAPAALRRAGRRA